VQNIDVMILAGFCRNCLAKWYTLGAREHGLGIGYDDANAIVYGMPYAEWKQKHQSPATPEQLAAFERTKALHAPHPPLPSVPTPPPNATHRSSPAPPPPLAAGPLSDVCCTPLPPVMPSIQTVETADEPAPPFPVHLRVGILTVSDRAAAGQYADESGPEVRRHVEQHAVLANWTVDFTRRAVVPDEAPDIQATLTDWSSPHSGPDGLKAALCNVILTTGGTGFAPRDVTPEATRAVLEKLAPGLMTAVLLETMEHEPLAVLSRAVAGVRHRTLIVNLPGRPRAVAQTLKILLPFLGHAVAQVDPPATDPP
jgi:molybdopterin adenylyltransferase